VGGKIGSFNARRVVDHVHVTFPKHRGRIVMSRKTNSNYYLVVSKLARVSYTINGQHDPNRQEA
jgi:hypothetical protein